VQQSSQQASAVADGHKDMERSPRLAAALGYAARGWPVFPVHSVNADGTCTCSDLNCGSPGKHPHTAHGFNDATTDLKKIKRWWQRWPEANVGIATGEESGVVVLDIDPDHGGVESLARLEAEHGALPDGPRVKSGGGGTHYYFGHPGERLRNSAGKVGPGLDIRGDGGYIIAPPSRHVSGGHYEWQMPLDGQLLPEMPQWMLALAL